jgi:hypothetical protein
MRIFESKSQPLLPAAEFARRMARSIAIAAAIIAFSLGMGSAGYHYFGELAWVDALLNAAMILTGMGPVDAMSTTAAKLFATFYALYSGTAFLTTIAVVIAPLVHRFLHNFHVDDGDM